ncbi:MAG: HEPN domain-containing protein [Bacteroidetes bacterium]|jgi:hypothetical protein|nr:HEPN domain-containing protein [Bacteroidota bacterium]
MLTRQDLLDNVDEKLRSAQILYDAASYDSSFYLCGYAVELALKARIVKHLKWKGFPENKGENAAFRAVAKHDLDYLLRFTGIEAQIKPALGTEWTTILEWNVELRYKHGHTTASKAKRMLEHSHVIIQVLKG